MQPTGKTTGTKRVLTVAVMVTLLLAAGLVQATEASVAPGAMEAKADGGAAWPLWDGKESVADYAKRAGIKDVEMTLDLGGGVAIKLTLIPAGKYLQGLRGDEIEIIEGTRVVVRERDNGWRADNGPQKEVTLTKPFYMGIYEVTHEQFEQVTGTNPSHYKEGKTHPVNTVEDVGVSGAIAFCEKVSAKTGLKVSLPTEAQWEYACMAGTKTRFYFGDDPAEISKYENFKGSNDGFETTAPVGSFKPNPWGLYDMLGNVDEWVSDWVSPYFGAPTVDPAGPAYFFPLLGEWRLWKGSRFEYAAPNGSFSIFWKPLHAGHGHGFRVVAAMKSNDAPTQEAKAKNPPKAAPVSPVLSKAGPADPKARVPAGCRAASGTLAEPYTKSGWAQAIVHEATGMELVYVPAGSFVRGINLQDPPAEEQDMVTYLTYFIGGQFTVPIRITLTTGFYMGKTEVTQAQWEKMMGKNPAHFKDVGPDAPAEMVSWNDCQEFCQKAGGGLRLPTEAEWEYACRAGTKGLYAGDLEAMGWYLGNSDGTTHPVGTKKPNAWGLHDMHGNVWEWCQDWFAHYEGSDNRTDPAGPTKETGMRVIRGGGWGDYGVCCSSAIHASFSVKGTPGPASFAIGCRFVITAAGTP